jgi:hypothetical protein
MTLTKKLKKEMNRKERHHNKVVLSKEFELYEVKAGYSFKEAKFLKKFHKRNGRKSRNRFTKKSNNLVSIRYFEIEE